MKQIVWRLMVLAWTIHMTIPARADVPVETPAIQGTLLNIDLATGTLTIRRRDGQVDVAALSRDVAVVIAKPLPRTMMRLGEMVAVNASDIHLPEGRVLVAGIYLQTDPSVPEQDREELTREFLPASRPIEGSSPSRHVIVSGRLLSIDGTSMIIESGHENVRVKLSPEAIGDSLRRGGLSDLYPGSTVTMALPDGGVRAILMAG